MSIFALSFTVEEAASKLIIFLMFGLGFGMPLLLLSFLAGATQRKITRLFAHAQPAGEHRQWNIIDRRRYI